MSTIIQELRDQIQGEVRDDPISLAVYSVDASIYEIPPLAVVLPRTKEELMAAVRIAARHDVPVIPRGAATGIAGGCIGKGLVIDTSKHLNRILSIDPDNRTAICEPGVVQNQLNRALAPMGLRLGPDTSTGNRATLGGMLANNSAGARSLRYGKMVDHILEVEVLLANGELVRFRPVDDTQLAAKLALDSTEGIIYREVVRIRDEYAADIKANFPIMPRRASGYNLDELLKPGPLHLSRLIAGSEGTLGIVTEMRVRLAPTPRASGICVVQFASLDEAFDSVARILPWDPLALELIDEKIVAAGRASPSLASQIGWINGSPKAVLIVEFEAATDRDVAVRIAAFTDWAQKEKIGYSVAGLTQAQPMRDVWSVRESGLGLLLSKRSYSRAIAFIEDVAVPPDQLRPFMNSFLELVHSHGKDAGVYGHVGAGCMHIRPYIDLRDTAEVELMKHLQFETADLLLKHRGALSGEHGDGFVRSWLNEKMFGKRVYEAFRALKQAFDPRGLMNPGKVIATQGLTEHLRLTPQTQPLPFQTFLNFDREGGFTLAADLCNGNGLCRKREGLMCPSFQAYGDEFHTTRARAQSFRAILNGRLPEEAMTGQGLYHVLEYCLECKGCKTQCPSQVDMAKMKSEFLYHYQQKQGVTLRTRLFAQMGSLYSAISPIAPLFNALSNSPPSRWLLSALGIAPERPLPKLSTQRFSVWWKSHQVEPTAFSRTVVVFNDTYTEFLHPEIGQAAVQVLNALGYGVIVPLWTCCGRPLISKGLLEQAQSQGQKLVDLLLPYARKKLPIIGLEPSCLSALQDDYRDLVDRSQAEEVRACCTSLEEFLFGKTLPVTTDQPIRVYTHTHCHQKALMGSAATQAVLAALPGVEATEIDSGCCGLAGSFGYEKEHYAMSMQIGEQKLFPAVRQSDSDACIVACGFSCRSQIKQGTERRAIHLAELLAQRLI